jgi:hypothetical protein
MAQCVLLKDRDCPQIYTISLFARPTFQCWSVTAVSSFMRYSFQRNFDSLDQGAESCERKYFIPISYLGTL